MVFLNWGKLGTLLGRKRLKSPRSEEVRAKGEKNDKERKMKW